MIHHIAGKPRALHSWRRAAATQQAAPLPDTGELLPPAVSLRASCPPVGDQGRLGSCVANALCEAMEFLEGVALETVILLFSRLYLYFWGRAAEGVSPADDSGMVIPVAAQVLCQKGVPYEKTWPYAESEFSTKPSQEADIEAAKHRAVLVFSCPNLFTIKASLAAGYPVVFGMDVYASLMSDAVASGAPVQMPDPGEQAQGGHCVMAVGYDDAKDALLFQNSWGTGWALDGFAWLPYQFVIAGIASDFTTIRRAEV